MVVLRRALSLFDHLVGTGEQRRRHLQAQCLRGFEVDHQLVFRRRLHRQVGGPAAARRALNDVRLAIGTPTFTAILTALRARAFVFLKGVSGLTAHIRDPTRLSRREA